MRIVLTLVLTSLLLSACDQHRIASTDPQLGFTPGAASERWVVINYWAKWCAPCREEIPELNHFAEQHADQVQVFGVNYDRLQGEALKTDMKALDIRFPVLLDDPHPALGIERPSALPATLVIAPDGGLQQVLLGPQTADSLARQIADQAP